MNATHAPARTQGGYSHLDESVCAPNSHDVRKIRQAAAVLRLRVKDGQFRNEVIEFLEEVVTDMEKRIRELRGA